MMELTVENNNSAISRVNTSHGGQNTIASIIQSGKPPVTKRGINDQESNKKVKRASKKNNDNIRNGATSNLIEPNPSLANKKKGLSSNDLVDAANNGSEERKTIKSDKKIDQK